MPRSLDAQGRPTTVERIEEDFDDAFRRWRPDALGGYRVWLPHGRMLAVDYFSSEAGREQTMEFVPIIEFNTSRIDEFNAGLDEWLKQTAGQRAATRGTQTKDRDRPNTYVQIVEFPSYEEAMANANLPGTSAFAAQLASLCESPPKFRNLDVTRRDEM